MILLNIFINYFLLLCTAKFNRLSFKRLRIMLGATVGSAFSLIILLPEFPFWQLMGLKAIFSVIIVLVSFPIRGIRLFLKNIIVFYIVGFLFAGTMIGVWFFMSPVNLQINNGTVYFQFSMIALLIATVVIYLVMTFFFDVYQKVQIKNTNYFVKVKLGDKSKTLKGFLDTGNQLVDVFTGKPVVVCSINQVKDMISEEMLEKINLFFDSNFEEIKPDPKIRYVPFKNVGSNGLLPAIQPDGFQIQIKPGYTVRNKELLLALSREDIGAGEYEILLNTQLFERETIQ